jgi:hypothetical protein
MGSPPYNPERTIRLSYPEFRWTAASVVALACSTGALAAAALLSMAENNFTYRPSSSTRQYHDRLIYDFKILQAVKPPHAAEPEDSSLAPPRGPAQESAKETDGCSEQVWPYFGSDCLWSAKTRKHPRIVMRLKSPWCVGVLQHQPFHSCRPRPR